MSPRRGKVREPEECVARPGPLDNTTNLPGGIALSDSTPRRSLRRFQITADQDALIEVTITDRCGLTLQGGMTCEGLRFCSVTGCRTSAAYGFTAGELLIVDTEDEMAHFKGHGEDGILGLVPLAAIVARGVAL